MEDNQNKNNGMFPKMPSPDTLLASWSVFLGGMGLVGNCCCGPIYGLPAGLTLGLIGIACAVMSKKGKPFSQQAQLGLILSILAAVFGLLMTICIVVIYDVMETNTVMGQYFRHMMEAVSDPSILFPPDALRP